MGRTEEERSRKIADNQRKAAREAQIRKQTNEEIRVYQSQLRANADALAARVVALRTSSRRPSANCGDRDSQGIIPGGATNRIHLNAMVFQLSDGHSGQIRVAGSDLARKLKLSESHSSKCSIHLRDPNGGSTIIVHYTY